MVHEQERGAAALGVQTLSDGVHVVRILLRKRDAKLESSHREENGAGAADAQLPRDGREHPRRVSSLLVVGARGGGFLIRREM